MTANLQQPWISNLIKQIQTRRKFIVQRSSVLPYRQEVCMPESPMILN